MATRVQAVVLQPSPKLAALHTDMNGECPQLTRQDRSLETIAHVAVPAPTASSEVFTTTVTAQPELSSSSNSMATSSAPEAACPPRISVTTAGFKRPATHSTDASEAPVVAFKVRCGGHASQSHGIPQRVGAIPTGGAVQASMQSGIDDELECRLQDMMHYVQDDVFPRMECAAH